MDRWEQIARLLGMQDPPYDGPLTVRRRPLQTPRRYPGQHNAPEIPLPHMPERPNLPGFHRHHAAPASIPDTPGSLRKVPAPPREAPMGATPLRMAQISPYSPSGWGSFADWINAQNQAEAPALGGGPAEYGHNGFEPLDAPGPVPQGNNGMFDPGPEEDLNRLRLQEDAAYRQALDRARNRLQRGRSGPP